MSFNNHHETDQHNSEYENGLEEQESYIDKIDSFKKSTSDDNNDDVSQIIPNINFYINIPTSTASRKQHALSLSKQKTQNKDRQDCRV